MTIAYTPSLHCTFSVASRYRDVIKNMTIGALQADMTLIMVCMSTRPTVQCESKPGFHGEEASSEEQDESIVNSMPKVLLQGAAIKRNWQTMIAAVSARRTSLRAEPDCVHPAGQGAVRNRSAQAELARRTRAKKEHSTELSQLASRIPAVANSGAGAGRLDHGADQQVADDSPSAARAIERL